MWRVQRGKRGSDFGFWVSKPGYDVTTCGIMDFAFTSDAITPRLVAQGTIVNNPIWSGAPNGPGGSAPGATETVGEVLYGRTINPRPFVFAIALASNWDLTLYTGTPNAAYLRNQWCSYIYDTCNFGRPTTAYGPSIEKDVNIAHTWAALKFIPNVLADRVQFKTNCRSPVTIKYLIMEP